MEFRDEYVSAKVDEWIDELRELEKIARVDPHIAYCAYVSGIQHRYTYVLRTIPDINHHLVRLDEAIDHHLLNNLLKDHVITPLERMWISLPTRLGGLGINIICEMAPISYKNSRRMTANLVRGIKNQHCEVVEPTEEERGERRAAAAIISEEKKVRETEKVEALKSQLDAKRLKLYEAITEKGVNNWLNSLPLKEHNFHLDKQLFWDTINVRFGKDLSRLPAKCVCNADFSVEHALNCKLGGFVSTRHNDVRDFTAELLSEVSQDVAVEPLLTPLTGENLKYKSANTDDHARLDISARGVWINGSRAFFDVDR